MNAMRKAIFRLHNPFQGIDVADGEIEMYGWNFDHPIFQRILEVRKPTKIIEIGTLYGASAIHMAKLAKGMGLEAEILCIDTLSGVAGILGRGPDGPIKASMRLPALLRTVHDQYR
jgi:hypothetical protein